MHEMARQTEQAIAESDIIVFVVDGRAGITAQDKDIANKLRKIDRPIYIAVNKAEGMDRGIAAADFTNSGWGSPTASPPVTARVCVNYLILCLKAIRSRMRRPTTTVSSRSPLPVVRTSASPP